MFMCLGDFSSKEVINIKSGCKLGYIDDINIDTDKACIVSLIIKGRPRFFGLLGRGDDMVIDWENVKVFGEDTILVAHDEPAAFRKRNQKRGMLGGFFS